MPRSKLRKFKELHDSLQVIEVNNANFDDKLQKFIRPNKTLTLELGCGRAEYALALAKNKPSELFIGLEKQGERLWYAAQILKQEKIDNVLLLRLPIEKIDQYFPRKSVDNIWLTFPDPYPKKKQAKKRLTGPAFLKMYKKILRPEGLVYLKTDDKNLLAYSLETVRNFGGKIIAQISDIHHRPDLEPNLKILTSFEKKHLAKDKKIHFLSWQFAN